MVLGSGLISRANRNIRETPKWRIPMPVNMHFATFLKFLSLSTGDKVRDLEKYAKGGGFDFYRPSRDGVTTLVAQGQPIPAARNNVDINSTDQSRDRNLEIFDGAAAWVSKQSGSGFLPDRKVYKSPAGSFTVRITPEIGLQTKSKKRIIAVYPRMEPPLSKDVGGAAILLLERTFQDSNVQFGILDAIRGKVCQAGTNVSARILDNEIAFIDAELHRILP